jgi:hypothetical protein
LSSGNAQCKNVRNWVRSSAGFAASQGPEIVFWEVKTQLNWRSRYFKFGNVISVKTATSGLISPKIITLSADQSVNA